MPRKSKKSKSRADTDLREDIQGAPSADDDEGFDIADDLLAALDAREAAEAAQEEEKRKSKSHGLREAGGRLVNNLLHPHSSLSPPPHSTELAPSPNSSAIRADATETESSSSSQHGRKGSLRRIFGGSSRSPDLSSSSLPGSPPSVAEAAKGKKVSRQQMRKERKAAEIEAVRKQALDEVNARGPGPDPAELERQGIDALCSALGVTMHEINPDGHCLYAAVADQLNLRKKLAQPVDFKATRRATAQEMRSHPDEFTPFISDNDEHMAGIENKEAGTLNSEQAQQLHFLSYCNAVEQTGVWGGQPEILALSRAYQTQVNVVQAGMPVLKVGEGEYEGDPIFISYHRKMYGLGEHYNSLRPTTA